MIAGIDSGYDSHKIVTNGKQESFKSVVGTPERSRFSLNGHHNTDIVLTDQDGTWLIGDSAVEQSRFIYRREDHDWYKSAEYRRLMLAAFGQLTTGTAVRMDIVTGLPVAYYETGKDDVRDLFTATHRVEIAGRTPQRIEVTSCRVIPQPFGTVLSMAFTDTGKVADKSLIDGPVGVIDVGGKTTNILSVKGFSEVSRETTSVPVGAWDIVRAVRDALGRQYPELQDRSDHEIMAAVRNREIYHFGRQIDLSETVTEAVNNMAGTILSTATRLWKTADHLRAVLVSGGGAHWLGQNIVRSREFSRHSRVIVVPDPTFANAIGYWKLGVFLQNQR